MKFATAPPDIVYNFLYIKTITNICEIVFLQDGKYDIIPDEK